MRLLAEFIMRGRMQAAIVALIGNWVPLLTPGAVALVTLRAGAADGLLVLLWGLLPAVLMLGFSQIAALVPMLVVSGLVLTYLIALLLRGRAAWGLCLTGAVALATLLTLLQQWLVPGLQQVAVDSLVQFQEFLREWAESEAAYPAPGPVAASGLLAYGVAFTGILGLVLGRWWQALLYNPGGFAREFQALSLTSPQALVALGAGIYCLLQGPDYAFWAGLFTMPLLFVGVAIVHRVVALKGLRVQWLVGFYLALLVLTPVTQVLIILGFLDTWLNIRGRVKPKPEV